MRGNKTTYRIVLLLSFLGLNAAILAGIGSVWSYLNTGADRTSILHLPKALDQAYLPKMVWDSLQVEGRPMESPTLQEIERDYLSAWYIRNRALETNSAEGLADYFTDSARTKLYKILDFNRQQGTHVKVTTLEHHPRLDFYSADGKMVVLTDYQVRTYEEVYRNKLLVAKRRSIRSYQILLLLEDGFWRVRHWQEITSEPDSKTSITEPSLGEEEAIQQIKGINYYPQQTPWNMFGTNFNDRIIQSDFKKIRDMGLNTIRIFVPYTAFGKAKPDAEKLERLKQTLVLAEANDLKVVVTLFDFYGDYSLYDWTLTHRYAEQIVNTLKESKALLAWDLKNEPDLDFESRGRERVLKWLRQLMIEMRRWDSEHPMTIGWSSPEAAVYLSGEVDMISFHYYREAVQFPKAYTRLRDAVPNKPLVLQEYGFSSYDGLWNAYTGSEEEQAAYYAEIQPLLQAENIPFLLWTLYDFEEVPSSVVGRLPWRTERQKHFGILDSKGTPKAAYNYLCFDCR
ncbi:cellulase family glycosylhydrolase [Flavobacteriaceae bacterium TP-CH-4]|uniref:Cellulase family glycosylhydrolase n=1 Tax=Pelagihabitans pacificus TaxID=2696054 RepID=A0A967AQM6_9FLAO|nr:cellulase family glycosylhydrolase [Pelagihabitans pacificus]NHF58574.1 cellulase family glycosylhydrolase [Pelagihabitans pacificus]